MVKAPIIILGIVFILALGALSLFSPAERVLVEESPLARISEPARPAEPDEARSTGAARPDAPFLLKEEWKMEGGFPVWDDFETPSP